MFYRELSEASVPQIYFEEKSGFQFSNFNCSCIHSPLPDVQDIFTSDVISKLSKDLATKGTVSSQYVKA